jgi:hypothetical protein
VCDEVIEGVKNKVVRQEELGGPSILPGVNTAVLNFPIPPEERQGGVRNRPGIQRPNYTTDNASSSKDKGQLPKKL